MKINKPRMKNSIALTFKECIEENTFSNIYFSKSPLNYISIQDITFDSCHFNNINFSNIKLANVDLIDCYFENCDLSNINFSKSCVQLYD